MRKAFLLRYFSLVLAVLTLCASVANAEQPMTKKIPVIFDTDIGNDIDDMWALALLLRCPELDVKLVVTDMGEGTFRAKVAAKFLEIAQRTDIPIGVGHGNIEGGKHQEAWLEGYDLATYPGTVYEDGPQALIDTINRSEEIVTIIAVGPVPNIAEALRRDPSIASKARFVGMHGSVRKGYDNSETISAEWNVRADVPTCRTVLTAPWQEIVITPLDTCGTIVLQGDKFAQVRDSEDPLLKALIESYNSWKVAAPWFAEIQAHAHERSSTLFDTVAVYLAITDQLCKMETLPIRVTDEGMTVIDPDGKKMQVATEWKDMGAFEDWMVERLTNPIKE